MWEISTKAKISKLADIEKSIRGSNLIIAEGVHIDSFVKIKFVGGIGDIKIGKNSYINSGTVMYSGNGILIGDDVLVASNCTLAPVNHETKKCDRIINQGFKLSKGGIIIEDDVWIGANTVILDGSILRKGCVVGAHSLVHGELKSYSINVGSPIKRIGYRQ